MSIKVMSLVWDKSRASGTDLLVMLAMADWGNDDGGSIYPSIPTLAKKLRLKDRATQYAVKRLIDSGEITVSRGSHRIKDGIWTNEYRINISQISSYEEDERGATECTGAKPCTRGVHSVAPNPLEEPLDSIRNSKTPAPVVLAAESNAEHNDTASPLQQDAAESFAATFLRRKSVPKPLRQASSPSQPSPSLNPDEWKFEDEPRVMEHKELSAWLVDITSMPFKRVVKAASNIGAYKPTQADCDKFKKWWYEEWWMGRDKNEQPVPEQV